jgi:catechol-2,3-dioxygenase
MKTTLGHVVLNVTSIRESERFYRQVLGMKKRRGGKVNGKAMVFLTFGSRDHDVALLESDPAARCANRSGVGLRHIAFRIGERLEELRAFKKHLDKLGIAPNRITEHRVSQSIYLHDPDGVEIEIYVDSDTPIWQARKAISERNTPLKLS